jgi:nitrogen fixation NifU-like protein
MLQELYQEVILDHSKSPRNSGVIDEPSHQAEGFNPFCGDQVKVMLIVDEGLIQEIRFSGQGCAISQASASMMTQAVKGHTVAEARDIFKTFHKAVTEDDEPDIDVLNELASLCGVKAYPSRIKCATLAWHAMEEALENHA